MKLNSIFLFFFVLLVSNSIAQEAICDFGVRNIGGVSVYSCGLSVNNPNGLELTSITGIHLEGFTDADVLGILRVNGSLNSAFPPIFCERFPNIQRALVHSLGLTDITDDSFSGCLSLEWLYILSNRITSISENAFVNNRNIFHIDLDNNLLSTLPENVFSPLINLTTLDIRNNPFENIPAGLFSNLNSLSTLYLQNTRITAINPDWFATIPNLQVLNLSNNQIREISTNSFTTLVNLSSLSLYNNQIQVFNVEAFAGMRNLQTLSIGGNNIAEIAENSFAGLENLLSLDLSNSGISNLQTNVFNGLSNLTSLSLSFNNLEDLPAGIFAPLTSIQYCGLWNNRIKSLRRNVFGDDLSTLSSLDLDENVVNSIERNVIEDAINLDRLLFSNNFCASGIFNGFIANRVDFMQRLERCFRNFELIVEATTDNNLDYLFFAGENPGIAFRVQAEDEIQIALTPFNFPWSPMLEVIIGAANNTRSIIRRNQNEDVAVVPSPGIIRTDQLNLFRIVWANNVILVFRENEQWPFLVHTMIDFFNVNFYGLRTPQSRATWSVQPIGI